MSGFVFVFFSPFLFIFLFLRGVILAWEVGVGAKEEKGIQAGSDALHASQGSGVLAPVFLYVCVCVCVILIPRQCSAKRAGPAEKCKHLLPQVPEERKGDMEPIASPWLVH